MAGTVQIQFDSAGTEMYQDACVGSSIEDGVTIITCDLRQPSVFAPKAWKTARCRAAQAGLYGATTTIYKC
jgi:hypothetical protein